MDKDKIKMIRLQGKSLDWQTNGITDFATRGLRASWTILINAGNSADAPLDDS